MKCHFGSAAYPVISHQLLMLAMLMMMMLAGGWITNGISVAR